MLDVRAVAINLLRPAWDDFEIAAIHAPPEIIERAPGRHGPPLHTIERLLDPAFDVGGAFFIPAGAIDEADLGGAERGHPARRPPRPPRPLGGGRRAHRPDPLRRPADRLRVDRRTDVRPAPGAAGDRDRHRGGRRRGRRGPRRAASASRPAATARRCELLFELSASLTNDDDVDTVLLDCCDGIRRALGFERVVIEIADDDSDQLRLRAALGLGGGPARGHELPRRRRPALRPRLRGRGLLPVAGRRGHGSASAPQARRYESRNNGVGPLAWDHHWLMVPLRHADGRIGGWVWPDDPSDHLLPTPAKLRILRTFANQALAAVSDAAHVDQLKALARVDELTGVAQPAGLLRAARQRAAPGPPGQGARRRS